MISTLFVQQVHRPLQQNPAGESNHQHREGAIQQAPTRWGRLNELLKRRERCRLILRHAARVRFTADSRYRSSPSSSSAGSSSLS